MNEITNYFPKNNKSDHVILNLEDFKETKKYIFFLVDNKYKESKFVLIWIIINFSQ